MSDVKVKASLSVHMFADCPKCEEGFDLMDVHSMNEEGEWWNILKGDWEKIGHEFKCPKCKTELVFDELEY